MFTFEIIQGDVFDVDGDLLAVTQVRVNKVGNEVRHYVRYVFRNEIKNRPSEEVAAMLADGLERGAIRNINRPADFSLFQDSF